MLKLWKSSLCSDEAEVGTLSKITWTTNMYNKDILFRFNTLKQIKLTIYIQNL